VEERTSQSPTEKSEVAHKTALRLIPGGTNSPADASGTRPPLFVSKARGALLTDLDGNEYIDYACARGALILGHADERVVVAIDKAASKGYSLGAPTESEARLAELLVSRLPKIDMVKVVNGTVEATGGAIRLARAFTGRERIVRFEGCYHGPVDALLGGVAYGGAAPNAVHITGMPERATRDTFVLPYNDPDAVDTLFADQGDAIAAVILEPVAAHMGLIPPAEGTLARLRTQCDRHGALLIFDESVTGFRVGFGGAAARYDVTPDLVCLGPIVGGGLSLAALAGRKEIMGLSSSNEDLHLCHTLHGNPLAIAAGIATLQATAEEGFYETLEALASRLEEGLRAAAADAALPIRLTRVGSILGLFFTDSDVSCFSSARLTDADRFAGYARSMLERGVFVTPDPLDCMFVSAAHTEEQIDQTIEAAHEALRLLSATGN
jgi:glutamate-1-semialdehyde 2,1-aminomutase